MNKQIIANYLRGLINEMEAVVVDGINNEYRIHELTEKHRENVKTKNKLFPDSKYLPEWYIEECQSFNKYFDEEVKVTNENLKLIDNVIALKSNLTWFEEDHE